MHPYPVFAVYPDKNHSATIVRFPVMSRSRFRYLRRILKEKFPDRLFYYSRRKSIDPGGHRDRVREHVRAVIRAPGDFPRILSLPERVFPVQGCFPVTIIRPNRNLQRYFCVRVHGMKFYPRMNNQTPPGTRTRLQMKKVTEKSNAEYSR